MTLGDRIRALRKQKDITQEDLSRTISTKRENITNWELGRTKPDIDAVEKIANYFNVTLDYLISGNVQQTPSETLLLSKNGTGGHKLVDITGSPQLQELFDIAQKLKPNGLDMLLNTARNIKAYEDTLAAAGEIKKA
jgi:transcriptional regulator with XRE-family HTH domain